MAATGRAICRWGPGRKRWRRSPRPSGRKPWRRASICWAARRGDSTAWKPGTRLDVHITTGGERGAFQPYSLPGTDGAEPVHLLAPAEGRVHQPVQFRGRLFHRDCPLHFRALGGLFVFSPMALRNALPGYLRSPIAPGGGGYRLRGTYPGGPGLSWRDWRHLCVGRAGALLDGCAAGSAARRGLAFGAVLLPVLSIRPADGGRGARSRRLVVLAPPPGDDGLWRRPARHRHDPATGGRSGARE